jgi:hypothetical protein
MARATKSRWNMAMAGILVNLARPGHVVRRVRELGVGRVAADYLVKRGRLPLSLVGTGLRAARIAARPLDYARRRRDARALVRQTGNPLAIPDEKGFRLIAAGELPGHARALEICRRILRDRRDALAQFPDSYGINLLAADGRVWTKEPLDLRGFDDLLDLAVSPNLLAAAAGYLGEIPVLTSIELYCTTGMKTMAGNNFYHFDNDRRQVKFWMAVSDIDVDAGPFTFLPADQSAHVRRGVRHFGRITDEEVYALVPETERIEFTGAAGRMLLVDTCRCAHFGSRTKRGIRAMFLLQYQSAAAWFENVFYFHPVLINAGRYGNPIARQVFAQMRETVPGRHDA